MSARQYERELSAGGEGGSECGRGAAARVIPLNQAISAQRHVYPLLMIGGVYRASFAMGLAVYALPALSPSISRHRARMSVRSSVHALRRAVTESGAAICPREHEPAAKNMTQRPIDACTRQAEQDRGRPR